MATTTFSLNCPICLDKLRDPVVPPCGHLCCNACIKTYARASRDPHKATCPTCRAPFSIVMPDMSIVPNKYHTFISSPLRRVFLDAPGNNSRAVIKNLNAEIAALKERVTSLKHDKDYLEDRYQSAQSTVATLRRERNARLALEDKQNLNCFRANCTRNHPAVKRTRAQATLDDDSPSSSSDSSSSSEPGSSTIRVCTRSCPNGRRVVNPISTRKRAKYVDFESSSGTDF